MNLFIKNGHVIDIKSGINEVADIYVKNGKVAEILKGGGIKNKNFTGESVQIIDATGLYVVPGLIDAHCHLRDPGQEYKEDIESGTRSAAKGGFTSIACMPNTKPVIDNEPVVSYIKNKAEKLGCVNVYPVGAITKGLKGEELSEIGELKSAGAVGISDDGNPVNSSDLMKKALMYASMFNISVISHCEDMSLAEGGAMNEGYNSTVMGLKGIPTAAEDNMIARDLILSEYTGVPIHIAHVSTKLGVQLIRDAKRRGVKVTCETCPHYFSLTDDACLDFNTLAKVNPPLRRPDDVDAIVEGLVDGTIDMIATDHAPHHMDEKNVEFGHAANGMVGFETALPLTLTNLYHTGKMGLEQIVEKFTVNPASMLGLEDKGSISVGEFCDITIFDPNEEYTIDITKFVSKSKNSPFNGYKVKGAVKYTIVNGNVIDI